MIVLLQKEKSKMQHIKTINELIEVEEPSNTPKFVFFALKKLHTSIVDLEIISYVNMECLSDELRKKIRAELGVVVKGN